MVYGHYAYPLGCYKSFRHHLWLLHSRTQLVLHAILPLSNVPSLMKYTSVNGGRPSTNLVLVASRKTLIASSTRTRTPFLEFTVHEVDTLCKCILPIAKTTSSKHKRAEPTEGGAILSRSVSSAACSAEVSRQFTEPWHFCTFFNA